MPFPVSKLIQGRGQPTYVSEKETVNEALRLMLKHDYSQLPVVDDGCCPKGMITYESIMRARKNFGIPIDNLRVSNAIVSAPTFSYEDDLFDMLERLKVINAVLIIDASGKLDGIVTSYDTTEFFRRRAEDLMYIEDIEEMVRDFILARFTDQNDRLDETAIKAAIQKSTVVDPELKTRYKKALLSYLRAKNIDQIDRELTESSYSLLINKSEPKAFNELSLSEYITLLTDKDGWDFYQPAFDIDSKSVFNLLDQIRNIRNYLAHFQGELNTEQREKVLFCADWLGRCQAKFEELLERQHLEHPQPPVISEMEKDSGAIIPVDDQALPGDSRYAPLAIWLENQPANIDHVVMTFNQIEDIIGGPLPPSAYSMRSWWANDAVGHVQSQQWLEAGWRVTYKNMGEQKVTFARMVEREKAYIDFYSALSAAYKKVTRFPMKESSPGGFQWFQVTSLPLDGPQLANIGFAFFRGGIFGVELYIDGGQYEFNKAVFDDLYKQKDQIEKNFGTAINWIRLNDKRACRINYMIPGRIYDPPAKLKELRTWGIDAMERFQRAILEPANQALLNNKYLLER
jgi:CBS domain-containing protein